MNLIYMKIVQQMVWKSKSTIQVLLFNNGLVQVQTTEKRRYVMIAPGQKKIHIRISSARGKMLANPYISTWYIDSMSHHKP